MANKPMPPRRGLPDDAASDAVDNIGAFSRSEGRGGRFSAPDTPAADTAPRRGRRMLSDDDELVDTHVHSPYMRPGSSPVPPPPPTPVPPFRGGRPASAGATVIASQTATSSFASPDDPSSMSDADADAGRAVWAPGPVSGLEAADPDEHRHGADVLHHAPRRPGRRLRIAGLVVGGLVMALIAVFGIQALTRPPTPGPGTTSQTAGGTSADRPAFGTEDLPTVEEASKAAEGSWSILDTVETPTAKPPQIACVGDGTGSGTQPTLTRIRALATPKNGPAMVLRLDAYASVDVAKKVFAKRAEMVGGCEGVPALLASSAKVTGLADEAIQVTVIFQDAQTVYHTVLVARVGNSISMTDVLNSNKGIGAQQAVDATQPTISRFCKDAKGTCPKDPKAATAPLPPTKPVGWLSPNDIPRVTPGAGQWSANEPFAPRTQGAFCEDVDLERPGSKDAGQRTYLLAEDAEKPALFGLDEVSLKFGDEAAAKAFATKMTGNINACPKRSGIAKILERSNGTLQGADGKTITATTWKYSLTTDQVKYWQVAVVTTGARTIYLMTNVDANYSFTKAQYLQIALRAGLRASQQK